MNQINQISPEIETTIPDNLAAVAKDIARERKRTLLGIGATALAGILFGVQGILGKYAFDEGANVPTLLMFRFIMASLVIWLFLGVLFARKNIYDLRQPLPRLAGFGFLGLLWITNSLFY